MERALTIAAALVLESRILFLDRSKMGLDVVAALSLAQLVSNLHRQGLIITFTPHYLEEGDRLCNHIATVVKGWIVNIDSPAGLKE